MNYIKKIKSLGFKKVDNIAVVKHNSGYTFLSSLNKIIEDKKDIKKFWNYNLMCPRGEEDCRRSSSYQLKISDEVYLYLIIVRESYTLVVSDTTRCDVSYHGNMIKNHIYIPGSYGEKLNDKFWIKILSSLDKGLKREILLNKIMK